MRREKFKNSNRWNLTTPESLWQNGNIEKAATWRWKMPEQPSSRATLATDELGRAASTQGTQPFHFVRVDITIYLNVFFDLAASLGLPEYPG